MFGPKALAGFHFYAALLLAAALANLPPEVRKLEEAIPGQGYNGALQGANGAGKTGYMGPCPPSGRHRYRFTLYALAQPVDLKAGASKEQLLAAMQGKILAQGQLVGTYQR